MPRFQDLNLRVKLLVAFGVIVLWVALQSAFAFSTARSNEAAADRVEHSLRVINHADDSRTGLVNMQSGYRGFLLTGDEQYLEIYENGRVNYENNLATLRQITSDNPGHIEHWATIEERATTWQETVTGPDIELRRQVRDGVVEPPENLAYPGISMDKATFDQIRAEFTAAITDEEALLSERAALSSEQNARLQRALIVGAIGMVAIAIVMAWLLSRSVAGAVERLAMVAQQVMEGELGKRVATDRNDEIGRASATFDAMADRLHDLVGELQDVAEEAKLNEERIQTIMNSAAEGILNITADGTILDLNPAAALMFGGTPAGLRGRPVRTLLPDLGDMQSSNTSHGSDFRGIRVDGSEFVAEATVQSMQIGEDTSIVAVVRDISDRKQAEAELLRLYRQTLRAQGQTRAILDATNDVMIFVAPDRRVTMVNQRFGEVMGINPDEIVGLKMEQLGAAVGRIFGMSTRFNRRILLSAGDTDTQFEETIRQEWPEERELQLFSTPVHDSGGEHVGRLYVFRDVTHEREVDRMKTEFVSLVSHELRTPLTSIKGYVDLILDGEVGEVTQDQAAFLGIVSANAQRLVALINDLLDISRIEAGKVELRRTSFDVGRAIDGIALSFRPQMDARKQTLTVEIASDLPPAWADGDRASQILNNLISNAHKYTPVGGAITVRASRVAEAILIEVEDTGVGLTLDEQSKLFTRFYRANNRATQEAGGTGLGLSITRSLVEMHGGTITVSSVPDKGSTFSVTLPVYLGTGELGAVPKVRNGTGRILVIEDDPDIANLLRRSLERAGYIVTVAMSGAEAIERIHMAPPDLITLDVILPDTDGFTILGKLQADELTADIPVILLSMMPDEGLGYRLGAVSYLTKPVKEDLLVEQVLQFLPSASSKRVLVADDDPDIRRLLSSHIKQAGHQVLEAANGKEALDLIRSLTIDLAFIDIKMPEMDGIETLKAIRSDPDVAELPVIMMTVSPGVMESSRSSIEALGAAMFVDKSFTARELADIVRQTVPAGSKT